MFSYFTEARGQDIRLVELGIGILRADPTKEEVAPARGWALDVIEKYSDVTFQREDRLLLLKKPLSTLPVGWGKDGVWYTGDLKDLNSILLDILKAPPKEPSKTP